MTGLRTSSETGTPRKEEVINRFEILLEFRINRTGDQIWNIKRKKYFRITAEFLGWVTVLMMVKPINTKELMQGDHIINVGV